MNNAQLMLSNASAHALPLADGEVHAVVTSPPYWSLRKYAGQQERDWPEVRYSPMPGLPPLTIEPMRCALGLEPTPEAYVGHMVACFREVWRVLRGDGCCWIVQGDSYASGGGPEPMQTKWQVDGASVTQCGGKRKPSKDAGQLRNQFVCFDLEGNLIWSSGKTNKFGLGPFILADNKFYILNDNCEISII